jgi:hypothetical protein
MLFIEVQQTLFTPIIISYGFILTLAITSTSKFAESHTCYDLDKEICVPSFELSCANRPVTHHN